MQCYLCSGTEFSERDGRVRDAPRLRILECRQCRLVMLDSQAHIASGHYERSGMHGDEPPSVEAWLKDSALDDQRRFDSLKPYLVNRKVLDFGCGAAGFLDLARSIASGVTGIDPEQRIREFWGNRLRLFADIEEVHEKFDLITAFHVIEHLQDPRATVAKLVSLLNRAGRLAIEVPSSEDALLTLYANASFQRFTYWSQHLFLFNAETLNRLLLQTGVKVVSIQQYQRYPLSNHLHWLSRGEPGGHKNWSFLDTAALNSAYASSLAAIGKCDTLCALVERNESNA
jgi:2-polyprenyl-3-methyl-5-hydroxy-6-metoxy-1,4-benzoquinol methylase